MLTPEEIKSREFLVSLRGYDRDEVHSFLEQVARHVRDLQVQVESLQAGRPAPAAPAAVVAAPPAPAADTASFFADLGKSTQRILEAAHEAGSEIQRKARLEADHDLAEARAHASKLVAEGQRRREVIEGVVHMLEERRAALADDLRAVSATVEQVLADLAPRGHLPTPDELVAVAQITAPDEAWVPEDEDASDEIAARAASQSEADEVVEEEELEQELAEAGDEPAETAEAGELVVEIDEEEMPVAEEDAIVVEPAASRSNGGAKPQQPKTERAGAAGASRLP